MLYDEDRAEEALASRPKWERDLYQPDGMSAPPEPPPVKTLPHIRYGDPAITLKDALRHLLALAKETPSLVQLAPETLAEADDALAFAREAGIK